MLDRLERLILYFVSAPPVDSESLGRSAEKFRDLFDRASRLPRDCEACADLLIRELAAGFDPYSRLGRAAAPATSTSEAPEAEEPALATGVRARSLAPPTCASSVRKDEAVGLFVCQRTTSTTA